MKNKLYIIVSLSILAGCSTGNYGDLKDWMRDQKRVLKGGIEQLPAARTFVPVKFDSKNDPFKDRPLISIDNVDKDKLAPNPNRRKEPLEFYTVEQLKITGTLVKDKVIFAMIKTPDNSINYVTSGNYIGSNYGQITTVNDSGIKFNERIKENDEWKIKENHMTLE